MVGGRGRWGDGVGEGEGSSSNPLILLSLTLTHHADTGGIDMCTQSLPILVGLAVSLSGLELGAKGKRVKGSKGKRAKG